MRTALFLETAIPNRNAGAPSTEICLPKNGLFACQCLAKTGTSIRHIMQPEKRQKTHYGGSRMADCFNYSCPFRVNDTSSANRCECTACTNRCTVDGFFSYNRTLTDEELEEIRRDQE